MCKYFDGGVCYKHDNAGECVGDNCKEQLKKSTCDGYKDSTKCEFVDDPYNINGDCLAIK